MYQLIDRIFDENFEGDRSFCEEDKIPFSFLFKERKWSRKEVKEIYQNSIKTGIGVGLRSASVEGQRIDLIKNTTNIKHKEFLDKFHKLAEEYNCAIQYHPIYGMTVQDMDRQY